MSLNDFWSALHAVLIYDRGLSVAFPETMNKLTDDVEKQLHGR